VTGPASESMQPGEWWDFVGAAFGRERYIEKQRRTIADGLQRNSELVGHALGIANLTWRRHYRRCLRATFGIDPLRLRVVDRAKTARDSIESRRSWRLQIDFERANWLFSIMNREFDLDVAAGGDGWRAATTAHLDADRRCVWSVGRDAVLHPNRAVRAEASAVYVGTLLARVNADLVNRFPGAVMHALLTGSANHTPQTVQARAVRFLEWEGNPTRRHHSKERKFDRDGPPQPWPPLQEYDPTSLVIQWMREGMSEDVIDEILQDAGYGTLSELFERLTPAAHARKWARFTGIDFSQRFDPVQEFAALESAAQLIAADPLDTELYETALSLAEQAGLPSRQAQVYALAGAGLTHRQIADRLGIAVGTSKPTLRNAKAKLRETLGKAG
jgi:DNA-binding CsgD family transcriptional regulator